MQRVLIGVGAAIVLAGAVFAIVHFSSRPGPAFTPQNGWVPVVVDMGKHPPAVHVDRYFGSWRLICRDIGPRGGSDTQRPASDNLPAASQPAKSRNVCVVVLLMLREPNGVARKQLIRVAPKQPIPFAPKDWLNLRFQRPATGSGAIAALAYARGSAGEPSARPGAPVKQVYLRAETNTVGLAMRTCVRGRCFAGNRLSLSDLESILSAHTLAILLPAAEGVKADGVYLPTAGLKAALTALQQQPE